MNASARRSAIERLLAPASIAVVGASDKPMSPGANVLANLDAFSYPGEVHLVSRSRERIGERACVPSIADLPSGIDAAILVVPAAGAPDAVAEAVKRGIGGAVVFASGFTEVGPEGTALQDRMAASARDGGLALLGPNCLGFTNFHAAAPLTFERVQPHQWTGRGVAVVAQSGAMAGNIRMALVSRGLPVSHAISTGNEAVVAATDLLTTLVENPDIGTFAVFVEQLRDAPAFLRFAEKAWDAGKAVVLMHPGRSERSREAALSHTGAMAGDYEVMKAVVGEYGVSLVEGFDELFDTVALRHAAPQPRMTALGVMTNSGAVRGVALDICSDLDVPLPSLEEKTIEGLGAVLPDFAELDNPLDITAVGMSQPNLFGETTALMLADPGVDAVLVAAMGGNPQQLAAKWDSLKPVMTAAEKPVALCFLGDATPLAEAFMTDVARSGVPFFRSPERALRAFAHLAAIRRSPALHAPADMARPGGPAVAISEYHGKAMLHEAGMNVPDGALAKDADEARTIAGRLGYPVALKIQSPQILHKSDIGGLEIGIDGDAALETAAGRILEATRANAPDARIEGLLVEAMAPKFDIELVLSARRDPDWGVTLVVGLGGVWTELFRDVRMLPAGLSRDRLLEEIARLRAYPLFDGFRGRTKIDPAPLADAMIALDALMQARPEIAEIEINPLVLTDDGRALVLDALVSLTG